MSISSNFLKKLGLVALPAFALTALPSPAVAASSGFDAAAQSVDSFRPGIDLLEADRLDHMPAGNDIQAGVFLAGVSHDGPAEPRSANPLVAAMAHALDTYRQRWGSLPQLPIPLGSSLRPGSTDQRVSLLRERLGLEPDGGFDETLARAVLDYKKVHGLGGDATVDAATIASLNRGAEYYEKLLLLNLERLRAVPAKSDGRYILVDAAGARLWLYEDGRPVDSMKVVVGKMASPTPMMATVIRWVELSPYWNVPPDLTQKLVAPRVLRDGLGYLAAEQYEVLSDFGDGATPVDPATVDWKAVADGRITVRVRQRPGPTNAMGDYKFMVRNEFGVYLHDTPNKDLFAKDQRWLSNGCVRVEDARRLAEWIFRGPPPQPTGRAGEVVSLDAPVPVYVTYLTASPEPGGDGISFHDDPYARDPSALASLFRSEPGLQSASSKWLR